MTFAFKKLHDLWEFRKNLKTCIIEIKLPEIHLICDCTEEEKDMAVQKYHAVILPQESNKPAKLYPNKR